MCEQLYALLKTTFGDDLLLAMNQFLYWDARDPRQNVGPDVYGRVEEPDRVFASWKVWELGAPHFVVEVVSDRSWPGDVVDKPAVYDRLGVEELIVFDGEPGTRTAAGGQTPRALRAWRRVEGALVELEIEADRYYSASLDLWLRVVEAGEGRSWLRLARGAHGEELLPTAEETAAAERQRADAEQQRAEELTRQLAAARAELDRLRRS